MITIETNSEGKQHTVVWHKDECPTLTVYCNDGGMLFCHRDGTHIATALPALPRHPKREDAGLLYRYMAEGMRIYMQSKYNTDGWIFAVAESHIMEGLTEITHATFNGCRVEIAIEGCK